MSGFTDKENKLIGLGVVTLIILALLLFGGIVGGLFTFVYSLVYLVHALAAPWGFLAWLFGWGAIALLTGYYFLYKIAKAAKGVEEEEELNESLGINFPKPTNQRYGSKNDNSEVIIDTTLEK